MDDIFHYFIRYGIGLFLCFCFSFSLHAQEIIDSVQYRAVYDFSYKTHPEQTEFAKTDLMHLDIGEKATKFHGRYEQIRDSVKQQELHKGLSVYEMVDEMRKYKRGSQTKSYTVASKQKKVTSGRLFKNYYYEETLQMPQWQLMDSDKTELGGFKCKKVKSKQPLILDYENSADNKFTKLKKQKYIELENFFTKTVLSL